jgi:hypothetical protein
MHQHDFQITLIPVVYTAKPNESLNEQWKYEGKSTPSTTCLTFSSLKDNRNQHFRETYPPNYSITSQKNLKKTVHQNLKTK